MSEWEVCKLLMNTEDQVRECARILHELRDQGYSIKASEGLRRKVQEKLVRKGVCIEVRIELCAPKYGRRTRKIIILNTKKLWAIYEYLQKIKPPPVCLP